MVLAGLMLIGGWSISSFAATNSIVVTAPGKKAQSRLLMRSIYNPVTHAVGAVTVDEGPLVHTAQILPWGAGGDIVGKDDAARQADQVLQNVVLAVRAAGGLESGIVKVNICVARADILPLVREAMMHRGAQFGQCAMSFVTGGLTHPDALVAIDAVAVSDTTDTSVTRARLPRFSALKGTVASVLPGGGKYYVSGQAKNGPLPEAVKETLASLEKTLRFLSLDKSRVIQLKAYMQPISAADSVQAAITEFFAPDLPPPTVFVEWNSPTNTPIEIELIAADIRRPETNGNSVEYLTPPDLTVSKVFSRVAHVNYGRVIYFSSFFGNAPGPAATQLNDIYVYLDYFLGRVGTDWDHLVKATYYVTDEDASAKLNDIRPKFYNPERPPAASKAMVKGVGLPDRTVTVDLIGVTK